MEKCPYLKLPDAYRGLNNSGPVCGEIGKSVQNGTPDLVQRLAECPYRSFTTDRCELLRGAERFVGLIRIAELIQPGGKITPQFERQFTRSGS